MQVTSPFRPPQNFLRSVAPKTRRHRSASKVPTANNNNNKRNNHPQHGPAAVAPGTPPQGPHVHPNFHGNNNFGPGPAGAPIVSGGGSGGHHHFHHHHASHMAVPHIHPLGGNHSVHHHHHHHGPAPAGQSIYSGAAVHTGSRSSPKTGPQAPAPLAGTPPLTAQRQGPSAAGAPVAPLPPSIAGAPLPADKTSPAAAPVNKGAPAPPCAIEAAGPMSLDMAPVDAPVEAPTSPTKLSSSSHTQQAQEDEDDCVQNPVGEVSEESTAERVYSMAEMRSLRTCNVSTPSGVCEWLFTDLFRYHKNLQIPMHLARLEQIPADLLSEERNVFGCRLKATARVRPVRELHHKVMSVLSRVTPQKYAELSKELLDLPLRQSDDEQLRQVVEVFFQKAVAEQTFSSLYANLVSDICHIKAKEAEGENGVPQTKEQREKHIAYRMRRELLQRCQNEFQKPLQLQNSDFYCSDTGERLEESDIEEKRDRIKRRLCGNIKFVGELYKHHLVTERVLESIFTILVGNYDATHYAKDKENPSSPSSAARKEEYVFEVFVTLMKVVGKMCNENRPELVTQFMDIARKIRESHPVKRIQFAMMDLEDLEKRKWVPKITERLMTTEERAQCMLDEEKKMFEQIEQTIRKQQQNKKNNSSDKKGGHHHDPRHPHGTPTANNSNKRFPQSPLSPQKKESNNKKEKQSQLPPPPPPPSGPPPQYTPPNSNAATPVTRTPARPLPRSLNANQTMTGSESTGELMTPPSASATPTFPKFGSMSNLMPTSPGSPASVTSGSFAQISIPALIDHFVHHHSSAEEIASYLANLTEKQLTDFITLWCRRLMTTTKYYADREALPSVMLNLIKAMPMKGTKSASMSGFASQDSMMVTSQSQDNLGDSPNQDKDGKEAENNGTPAALGIAGLLDVQAAIHSWIKYDVEHGQSDNCPRMFANWGEVLAKAFELASAAGDDTFTAENRIAMYALMNSNNTFAAMLRTLVENSGTDVVVNFLRDVKRSTGDAITKQLEAVLAAKKTVEAVQASLTRFRPLVFAGRTVLDEEEGDNAKGLSDCLEHDVVSQVEELAAVKALLDSGAKDAKDGANAFGSFVAAGSNAAVVVQRAVAATSVVLELAYGPSKDGENAEKNKFLALAEGKCKVLTDAIGKNKVAFTTAALTEILSQKTAPTNVVAAVVAGEAAHFFAELAPPVDPYASTPTSDSQGEANCPLSPSETSTRAACTPTAEGAPEQLSGVNKTAIDSFTKFRADAFATACGDEKAAADAMDLLKKAVDPEASKFGALFSAGALATSRLSVHAMITA